MEKDIIKYLQSKYTSYSDVIFALRYPLLKKIYNYGDHFKVNSDNNFTRSKIIFWFHKIKHFFYLIFFSGFNTSNKNSRYKGLSFTNYSYDSLWQSDVIEIDRFFVFPKRGSIYTPWQLSLFLKFVRLDYFFNFKYFNELSNPLFFEIVRKYQHHFEKWLDSMSYDFFLLPDDLDFHSRVIINYANSRKKPTLLIAHGGMPNLYDAVLDNLTSFVSLWGTKQLEGYVKNSYPNKFFLTGRPYTRKDINDLKFSFENILVLTKSVNGVCPLDKIHIEDRGMAIRYLNSIQDVLFSIGLRRVRIRPHPSENLNWYKKFIDLSFFELDSKDISTSILSSSLIIGPISTVFIDSIQNGVNYVVYEPLIDGKTIYGYSVEPPLDGIDKRVPIARSDIELKFILENKIKIDKTVINEFVGFEFDKSALQNQLNKFYD